MTTTSGIFIVVLGDDRVGTSLRCAGWCIRDTFAIVTPSTVVLAYLARQPLSGTVVENVLRQRTGVINVDGCRISADAMRLVDFNAGGGDVELKSSTNGRWPPNILFVHTPKCRREGVRRVKGSPTSKMFHAAYEGQSVTGLLRGWSHPGNQHADVDGKEIVEQWACSEHCPSRLLNAMVGNNVDVAGVSRFYPQFPQLSDALDWLTKLVGTP